MERGQSGKSSLERRHLINEKVKERTSWLSGSRRCRTMPEGAKGGGCGGAGNEERKPDHVRPCQDFDFTREMRYY